MRKLGILLVVMLMASIMLSLAADYNVQYYYGDNTYSSSKAQNNVFKLGVYYRGTDFDDDDDSTEDPNYTGVGIRLNYDVNKYHFLADYFSGSDDVDTPTGSQDLDLRDFIFGAGYTYQPSESTYKFLGTILYRNLEFERYLNGDTPSTTFSGVGLRLMLKSIPTSESETNIGFHAGVIWFPSYSISGDDSDNYDDVHSFGWEIGVSIKFSQNWEANLSYTSENFDYDYSDNSYSPTLSTWRVGVSYKFSQ